MSPQSVPPRQRLSVVTSNTLSRDLCAALAATKVKANRSLDGQLAVQHPPPPPPSPIGFPEHAGGQWMKRRETTVAR
ncbi:hypothetical protein MMC32_005967 [Xylographa parallela]|nr:hypothetical protein [Xylographa parallela]